jgi:dTDP-4-dehydrorhamnose 3,5-epimerase
MQFNFGNTKIEGVKLITLKPILDQRGWFLKTFHAPSFAAAGICTEFPESFVSMSKRNVLRGMHFQTPPHDHTKLVRCQTGNILDVVLDLRTGSAAYGKHQAFTLDGEKPQCLYIPSGFAHGFLTLSEAAIVEYCTSTVHQQSHDAGIRWDSFGMVWGCEQPILSERDAAHPSFSKFISPFSANAGNGVRT